MPDERQDGAQEDGLEIAQGLVIPMAEIEFSAIRAQGAGGQNVNKVSSAVHLRFDIPAASLPPIYKARLLALSDSRITKDGVVVIKAQTHRRLDLNRAEALERLRALVVGVTVVRKVRKPTRPGRGAKERRLKAKTQRGRTKALRGRIDPND